MQQPTIGTTTYTWNGDRRLTSIQTPSSGTYTFTYLPGGLLFSKQTPSATTKYLWHANVLQAELDGSGTPITQYTQAQGDFGSTLASRDLSTSANSFPCPMPRAPPRPADNSGSISGDRTYDAFGRVIATSGTPLANQGLGARQGYLYQPDIPPSTSAFPDSGASFVQI